MRSITSIKDAAAPARISGRRIVRTTIGALALCALAMPLAHAAGGLGGLMTTDTTNQINPALTFGTKIAFVIGFFVTGIAVWKIWEANQDNSRTSMKLPLVGFLVGACLMVLPWVTGLGVNTVFSGGNGAAAQVQSINVGN